MLIIYNLLNLESARNGVLFRFKMWFMGYPNLSKLMAKKDGRQEE